MHRYQGAPPGIAAQASANRRAASRNSRAVAQYELRPHAIRGRGRGSAKQRRGAPSTHVLLKDMRRRASPDAGHHHQTNGCLPTGQPLVRFPSRELHSQTNGPAVSPPTSGSNVLASYSNRTRRAITAPMPVMTTKASSGGLGAIDAISLDHASARYPTACTDAARERHAFDDRSIATTAPVQRTSSPPRRPSRRRRRDDRAREVNGDGCRIAEVMPLSASAG